MEDKRYGKLELLSVTAAVVAAIAIFFIVWGVWCEPTSDPSDTGANTVPLTVMWAFWGVAAVTLGFGVFGLVRKGQREMPALAATVISAATVVSVVILWFFVPIGCERSNWDEVESRLDRIEIGMTYQEVKDAMGSPGQGVASNGEYDEYHWDYGRADGIIWVRFEDGRVTDRGFVGYP